MMVIKFLRCIFNTRLNDKDPVSLPEGELRAVYSKDLVMNVFRDGQWGSFRHLPLQPGMLMMEVKVGFNMQRAWRQELLNTLCLIPHFLLVILNITRSSLIRVTFSGLSNYISVQVQNTACRHNAT
jgi:hypothetical protein